MKTQLNHDQTAVAITGDHSFYAVYLTVEVANALGGNEPAFHEFKRLEAANLLPRIPGSAHPMTMRDLELARANEQRGNRHWQYREIARGHTLYHGYGYQDGKEFVFVNSDGSVFERVA